MEEQETILHHVRNQIEKFNRLIAIKQEKIQKLEEYKKSLIYEYATGKKEAI
jgi:type I restriction enzyme S subunit